MDLRAALPMLLPHAISWAESRAAEVARQPLDERGTSIALAVGVTRPEKVRIAFVQSLPMPEHAELRAVAVQNGLLTPGMVGLTLGHAVYICEGHLSVRLLSHELRHVYQYEQAGSIAAFLPVYLQQIAQFTYARAPLELDARAHEQSGT